MNKERQYVVVKITPEVLKKLKYFKLDTESKTLSEAIETALNIARKRK